jgi:hypothetical protein
MRPLLLMTAALAAACAHTPAEVRQSHFRFDFQSSEPKERSAACAARNAEGLSPRLRTSTRPGPAVGTIEVVVQSADGTLFVIETSGDQANASRLTVWVSSLIGLKEDMQGHATYLANTVAKGC